MNAISPAGLSHAVARGILEGRCATPHDHLGIHATQLDAASGVVVRALQPDATQAELLLLEGAGQLAVVETIAMERLEDGLFGALLPGRTIEQRYRFRFTLPSGDRFEREDPYRLWPTLGEQDLHLFNEGRHLRLWEVLGAHARQHDGHQGVAFAVWAPNAERVSVVGDFCGWNGRTFPMRMLGSSGIFELFIPGVQPGALYQYEIRSSAGEVFLKADPHATEAELPPARASRVSSPSRHLWRDEPWQRARRASDVRREPMAIYEVHLGSWRRGPGGRPPGYREQAEALVRHVVHFGFTHIELMPLCEHPFDGSWGYQVTGFFAPTARYGTPDQLRFLIDLCHQYGIGVILDWVPAHFPRDAFALARFDGTALYEHADPRRGEHPDWGTYVFNYGRHEVRNFLMANALYWLEEFHIDGLRVDAVASMIYRDYSRREGEWIPNEQGGREDMDAVAFLRELNHEVRARHPGCFTVAEESTAWPGVTHPPEEGGLGFTFKWNLGWMHDTLGYFARDPIHRSHHQDELTFAMMYEHSECFVMPLSHDEVVHGKGSLLRKMAGDPWQAFANLRALLCYQYTRPGKQLLFMGSELAPQDEWDHEGELPWSVGQDRARQGLQHLLAALGALYGAHPCLWRRDPDPASFEWIDTADHAQSVLSFCRRDSEDLLLVALNLTPVPRTDYRIGAPEAGRYRLLLDSDAARFGGSGFGTGDLQVAEELPMHGRSHSLRLTLPPLSVLILAWEDPPTDLKLAAAARRAGILDSYHSMNGTLHVTGNDTRAHLLEALSVGTEVSTPSSPVEIDPVRVLPHGHAATRELPLHVDSALPVAPGAGSVEHLRYRFVHGTETATEATVSGDYRAPAGQILIPWTREHPPIGQHTLTASVTLRSGAATAEVERTQQLFVVPGRTFSPWATPAARDRARGPIGVGLWIQLYALRDDNDYGIGDLGHLDRLVRWAGELGLDFIGLNPLHAASLPDHPVSPYFPSSRLFRNPLYIDLQAVPELRRCARAQALSESSSHRRLRARANRAPEVDYRTVEALKRPILEQLADHFLDHVRGGDSRRARAFERYLAEQGDALTGFATFCVLERELNERDHRRWPVPYRDRASLEVQRFAVQHARAIEREQFYQFELDRQLAAVAERAREAGMGIGLYLDLAVGSTHGGCDAWLHPALIPAGATLGAPPDALAPQGQDWGLAPLSPLASRAQGYSYFRALLRANMQHAGALRIDHVIGLARQFWIPSADAGQGAYVEQPLEELLGLVAAESHRARCVVIGEDLGTVPDGLREAMAAWGLLRMQVARFELEADHAAACVREGLATVGTHDIPPFASLWKGDDLSLRRQLGLCSLEDEQKDHASRAGLRRRWVDALVSAGRLPEGADPETANPEQILDATHLWLAQGLSRLVALSLADLCGEQAPANIPGTTSADGIDNWCIRHAQTLDTITGNRALAARISRCVRARPKP